MAWCHQAPSLYLSQCWLKFMSEETINIIFIFHQGSDSIWWCCLTSIGNTIMEIRLIRLSYLRNGIFYNGRVASLHGISPHSILNQPRTEIYQWEKWPYHFQSKLTHLSLDKMAAISQMIFSDEFVWLKSFVFWLKFHRGLFLKVQLAIIQHWFR